MALTLADLARQSKQPLQKYILQNLLRYSDLMALVPFFDTDTLTSIVVRWKSLPSVGYRRIGGGYSESTGTTEQVSEGVYGLGGDILFDKVFELVKNTIEDPKKTQTNMKIKAVAYEFNNLFVNGDHAVNVDMPEGVNKRVAAYLPGRQSISIGSALDVTASTANENKFIDYLHALVDLAGLRGAPMVYGKGASRGYKKGALLMNRDTYLGVEKVLRRLSLLDTTQDNYGRTFDMFANVPLVDVGLKGDQSTELIANSYGGGSNETRIYAVRFAEQEGDDGMAAIQLNTPEAYDPVAAGETPPSNSGPQKALRIDWWVGLAGWGSYYAARLTGVKDPTAWT